MPQTEIRVFRLANGDTPLDDWLATLRDRFPKAYAKCLAAIINLSQNGNSLRRPAADYLRDGIWELRAKAGGVNYRILYAFNGRNVAILTSGLTKRDKVPLAEIEIAIERMALVRKDPKKYTAEFEL